jgi:hypothetical protein
VRRIVNLNALAAARNPDRQATQPGSNQTSKAASGDTDE